MVELEDLLGRGRNKAVHHVLVGQEIGALDRVPGVKLEGVALVGVQDGSGAALGADRVGPHELDLGDDPDVRLAVRAAGDLDRGPESGQAGTENEHIMGQVVPHA